MEIAFDDVSVPMPGSFHASLTMEQAHFDVVMEEEQLAPTPVSVFREAREEQWYNLSHLAQHRLAEGQISGEFASEEAVMAMAAENTNFITEQHVLYEVARARANCNAVMAQLDVEAA